jgi:hypothetical protein
MKEGGRERVGGRSSARSGDVDIERTGADPGASRPAGHAFLGALASLLILAIFIPSFSHWASRPSINRSLSRQNLVALHLAECGLEQGLHCLESDNAWAVVQNRGVVQNFDHDMDFRDASGGVYRVELRAGPGTEQVTVRSAGMESVTGEVRAVEAIYARSALHAALSVRGDVEPSNRLNVHWGPIVAHGRITGTPSASFPRKFSAHAIHGRDTTNDARNSDRREYWAFDRSLGAPPALDMDYYRRRARETSLAPRSPEGARIARASDGSTAEARPRGSGYFSLTNNGGRGLRFLSGPGGVPYRLHDRSAVIVIENDAGYPVETRWETGGAEMEIEALIVSGKRHDLWIGPQSGSADAVVPRHAKAEYQHPRASTIWNEFADAWESPGGCCVRLDRLALRGLLSVGGDLRGTGIGAAQILGVVLVDGHVRAPHLAIYLDENVEQSIQLAGLEPRRLTWKETSANW